MISGLLDVLQRIHLFIERSGKVISLLLKQICAILGHEFITANTTSFPVPDKQHLESVKNYLSSRSPSNVLHNYWWLF